MVTQIKNSEHRGCIVAPNQKMFNIQKQTTMKNFNFKKALAMGVIATAGFTLNVNGQSEWNWAGTPGSSDIYAAYTAGNVAIGTTNPSAKLHVTGVTTNAGGFFSNSQGGVTSGTYYAIDARTSLGGMSSTAYGIHAYANNGGVDNYGIYGETGGTPGSGNSVGLYGKIGSVSSGAGISSGVYGDNGGLGGSGAWGGYFIGDVYSSTNTFTGPSDRKLKNNIKPMQNALDKLMLLKPSIYNYKIKDFPTMSLPQGNQMGLIAQEVEEVFPNLIKEVKEHKLPTKEGEAERVIPAHKSVNYTGLIPVLIAAVQEQQQQIQDLKNLLSVSQQKQSEATGIEGINAANGFSMEQNKPNPFDQSTVINYNLPASVNAAYLMVCDYSGKKIATYNLTTKTGSQKIEANDLPAEGIYLYSIVSNGEVLGTKKIVVSK